MKTVLVTGGSGFIGSHIIRRLADCGHRVFATEHRSPLAVESLCDTVLRRASTGTPSHYISTLRHCDAVIHAAAHVPINMRDPEQVDALLEQNAKNATLMALAARTANVRRFIFISTAQLYAHPARATAAINEDAATYPTGHGAAYLTSKLAGELLAREALVGHCKPVILRLGSVYGPGARTGAISRFVERAMAGDDIQVFGKGKSRFNPVWVGDVADIAERAVLTGSGIYNVTSGEWPSIWEAALGIEEVMARDLGNTDFTVKKLPDAQEGPHFPRVDNRKAARQWNFTFKPLREGLREWIRGGAAP